MRVLMLPAAAAILLIGAQVLAHRPSEKKRIADPTKRCNHPIPARPSLFFSGRAGAMKFAKGAINTGE